MSVRLRRLYAEHERLKVLFAGHPQIRIAETFGDPPDRYIIEYRVKGLTETKEGVFQAYLHRVQITLGPNYPNEMPNCMVVGNPVFHPNIDHLAICTADVSSASRTLDQTIVFIGELITFQAYNLQSPRNGEAKKWTEENLSKLPLERVELLPRTLLEGGQVPIPRPAEAPKEPQCANCGRKGPGVKFSKCLNNHITCPDCTLQCGNCARSMCLACNLHTCSDCKHQVCDDCSIACPNCQREVCAGHASQCTVCSAIRCTSCVAKCSVCAANMCLEHLGAGRRCPRCMATAASAVAAGGGAGQN